MAKRAKKKVTTPGVPPGESKLSANIPKELHRKLKAVAALRGIKIRELLIEYIQSLELKLPSKRRKK